MWIFNRSDESSNPFRLSPYICITQISYLPCPLPWNPYPHFHDEECECAFTLSGSGWLNLPGCRRELAAGTLSCVPPGVAHFYEPDAAGELEYLTIRFKSYRNGSPLEEFFTRGDAWIGKAAMPELYCQSFHLMETLFRSSGGVIDKKIQTLCVLFLEAMQEDLYTSGQAVAVQTPEYANDILIYLQQNIHRKITLEDLAERFSLSQSHLSRVFLKTYHISPINYLIYSRMRQARLYIIRDGLPPAEIAKRLCYHNTYHFTQAFEKFFHCRPEDYTEYVKKTER